MQQETHSTPKRRGSTGTHMETRPIYIEEWLDSLPYVDFNKTSRLLLEATELTNRENIKPEIREELVRLYYRPYLYYLDSQIKSGAQHSLQTMETLQGQVGVLKQFANNLAQACRLSIEEGQNRKTIWRQKKSPLPALLMQMNLLSHVLIFSYLEYAPVPVAIWRELNGLYAHAENMDQQFATVIPPGGDIKQDATTIANAYKRILLASMVDPYHLPFGAIWEIYIQLKTWSEHAQLKPCSGVDHAEGFYVIALDEDSCPMAYGKFDPDAAKQSHRLIDTNSLGAIVNKLLDRLNAGKSLDEAVHLSAFYAKAILAQMAMAWGRPAVRYSPRDSGAGSVHVSSGINAVYFYLNGNQEFKAPEKREEEEVITDVGGFNAPAERKTQSHALDQWDLVDQGPGGFAISKNEKPEIAIKVGDLIGIARTEEGSLSLGVIRWLMISADRVYRVGIQSIAADSVPAAIRTISGSAMETRFSRAIIAGDFSPTGANDVICGAGLYKATSEYELSVAGNTMRVRSNTQVETTANFSHFIVAPLQR